MKKILCLIIDCIPHEAWRETYEVHRQNWHRCLDLNSKIEGYFLHADPTLKHRYDVGNRRFTVRGEERYDTILHKTVKAIKVLLDDHDYVIRTNISSLWDFPLLRRLDLPKKELYMGHEIPFDLSFVSGSGMVMSRDVAKKLTHSTSFVLDPHDDVAIAQMLNVHGIRPQHRPMFIYDYTKGLNQLSIGEHFQYRLRDMNDPERRQERAGHRAVGRARGPLRVRCPNTPGERGAADVRGVSGYAGRRAVSGGTA
jgi:hypothetical protein